MFHFVPFGRGHVCFIAVCAGTGVDSLIGLSGWALRGLTTKQDQTATKKTLVYLNPKGFQKTAIIRKAINFQNLTLPQTNAHPHTHQSTNIPSS